FFSFYVYHLDLHSFPTRRSSDLATHSGQVIFADWSDVGYGYLVIIQNSQFITYYAHNTSFNVNSGDFVGRGSVVAWSGSTGNSRSEEHTSELQSRENLVCRLLLE